MLRSARLSSAPATLWGSEPGGAQLFGTIRPIDISISVRLVSCTELHKSIGHQWIGILFWGRNRIRGYWAASCLIDIYWAEQVWAVLCPIDWPSLYLARQRGTQNNPALISCAGEDRQNHTPMVCV